jgi:hypothetical protein
MERSWFVDVRSVEIGMAVLVAVVLMALVAITVRIARDPAESAVRRLMERSREGRAVAELPVEQLAAAAAPDFAQPGLSAPKRRVA